VETGNCPPDLVPRNDELDHSIIIRSQDDKTSTRTTNTKDETVVIPNERANITNAAFFDTLTWASGLSGASPPGVRSVSLSSSPDGRRTGRFLWASQVRKIAATIAPFCLSKSVREHRRSKKKVSLHPSAPKCEEVPPEDAKVFDDDDEDRNYLNAMRECSGSEQPLMTICQKEWHREISGTRYHG
jgi:hypothetical protein